MILVKSALMIDPHKKLDEIPEINLVSWNMIIGGLIIDWGVRVKWINIAVGYEHLGLSLLQDSFIHVP